MMFLYKIDKNDFPFVHHFFDLHYHKMFLFHEYVYQYLINKYNDVVVQQYQKTQLFVYKILVFESLEYHYHQLQIFDQLNYQVYFFNIYYILSITTC